MKDKGVEPSVSWARHQIAVTKYKETEKRSSSMYAIWDSDNGNPVVNFNSYIEDNEVLTDQVNTVFQNTDVYRQFALITNQTMKIWYICGTSHLSKIVLSSR